MESVLRIENGSIAVMGGLMEDVRDNDDRAVPFLNRIPLLGALFTQRNDSSRKSELVVFLRPVVIREASIAGDYKAFRDQLPAGDFFNKGFTPPKYQVLPTTPSGAFQ
jgi:general secretion pathway protein D